VKPFYILGVLALIAFAEIAVLYLALFAPLTTIMSQPERRACTVIAVTSLARRPFSRIFRPAMSAERYAELLAPAGDWECVRAAVANGADAVYFGLPKFNARLRAHNFTEAELPEVVAFCHRHGVKAYVALNTLIFTDELDAAAEELRLCNRAGVDALIVQDVGLVRLARAIAPELDIHASTQMTVTLAGGGRICAPAGVDRVVLARELSLRELENSGRRACRWRCSCMARSAWRIPANASPASRSASAARIAASAPRRAGCPTS